MPKKNNPGCGCCGGSVQVTVEGCYNLVVAGATVTATQNGQQIAQGTTDANGHYTFSAPSTAQVSLSVSATNYANGSGNVTPISGQTVNTTVNLSPATGYFCCCGVNPWPTSKTLTLTDPVATRTLTYNGTSFVSPTFTLSFNGFHYNPGPPPGCGQQGQAITGTFQWVFGCAGNTGNWGLVLWNSTCNGIYGDAPTGLTGCWSASVASPCSPLNAVYTYRSSGSDSCGTDLVAPTQLFGTVTVTG